ncbi:MAG: fumarylacetoacetate hydrolase family protein [Alphaproteobacteria bacterium]|nr:fumarylacetoacetate hydrolase family protein [Alphaproteobacteria bacterium]HPF47585.1 fumarylacetoacetate hydrolase family protein [Emcibacteraceae bacterium]HRW29753.1 fumarylacetoacetate hydrolase family protein [Emcibacteraceae bacterium]
MKHFLVLLISFLSSVTYAAAPSSAPDTPFKLATFDADGMTRLGLVLGNDTVLDIRGANAALSADEDMNFVRMPRNMLSLIENYDHVKSRLYQIANYYNGKADGRSFAFKLSNVTLQAPIKWPYNIVAAAANYQDHTREMSTADRPALKPVNPDVDPPVFFAKSPRSTILDPNSEFPIPKGPPLGRAWDFENELAVIIGKKADSVSLEDAKDYVFGYSIIFDVSARADPNFPRQEHGGFNFGTNWFEGKSRDNAAPFGPFITPKEFIGDSANLKIRTLINGVEKQNGNTKDMIHDEPRLIRHATSILTLYPGDVIMTGTPSGVGAARNPPEFLHPGDRVEMTIENIGTLVTKITEEK